jgi:cell division protein FtsA
VAALQGADWYRELPFTKRPSVQYIDPEQVAGISDQTGDITDHTFITAMGLLRVAHDTMDATDDEQSSVREKLNKLLRI